MDLGSRIIYPFARKVRGAVSQKIFQKTFFNLMLSIIVHMLFSHAFNFRNRFPYEKLFQLNSIKMYCII
jgi:hypothetical protein